MPKPLIPWAISIEVQLDLHTSDLTYVRYQSKHPEIYPSQSLPRIHLRKRLQLHWYPQSDHPSMVWRVRLSNVQTRSLGLGQRMRRRWRRRRLQLSIWHLEWWSRSWAGLWNVSVAWQCVWRSWVDQWSRSLRELQISCFPVSNVRCQDAKVDGRHRGGNRGQGLRATHVPILCFGKGFGLWLVPK